jgi:hypothetical protein
MVARVLCMADDADIAPVRDAADVALIAELGLGIRSGDDPIIIRPGSSRSWVSG